MCSILNHQTCKSHVKANYHHHHMQIICLQKLICGSLLPNTTLSTTNWIANKYLEQKKLRCKSLVSDRHYSTVSFMIPLPQLSEYYLKMLRRSGEAVSHSCSLPHHQFFRQFWWSSWCVDTYQGQHHGNSELTELPLILPSTTPTPMGRVQVRIRCYYCQLSTLWWFLKYFIILFIQTIFIPGNKVVFTA